MKWNTKHWMRYTRIYNIYHLMKRRCTNPKDPYYENYWGRWIKYDLTWDKFINFYNDMKEWYKDNLTLDRRDNDWHYCKSNCRWVTQLIQWQNRWNNNSYEWKCLAEWSRITWLKEWTIRSRLKLGWTYQQAIETQLHCKRV